MGKSKKQARAPLPAGLDLVTSDRLPTSVTSVQSVLASLRLGDLNGKRVALGGVFIVSAYRLSTPCRG